MEPLDYKDMLRRLSAIAEHQRSINDDLRAFSRHQVKSNAGVQTTLARIETLLARMLRHEANGWDA